jgi:hypothetical protein
MATPPKLALHTLPPECTVSTEAMESSSNGGSMARKRYQKGFVYLDGDKWKGRYREDLITGEGMVSTIGPDVLQPSRSSLKGGKPKC